MKIEKILTGFVVALMMLTACSDEEAISVPTGPASLSFSLAMGETKADAQQTVGATEDELYVSRFYVGIYDGDTKVDEFLCEDATTDGGTGWTVTERDNNKNLYTITDLVAPVNKNLNILVIANYPQGLNLEQGYSALKSSVVRDATLATTTFDPRTLVKVGTLEGHRFTESSTTARVNLKQLAAKVHVKLTMDESDPSDPVYDISTAGGDDVVGLINETMKDKNGTIKVDYFKGTSLEGKIGICSGNTHGGDLKFPEGFDKSKLNINHSGKWLVVLCDSVMTRTVSTWTLIPSAFQVNNVAIASFIASPATGSEATGNITYSNKEDVIKQNIIELTFYTYPKKQNSDLTLNLGGKLQKISKVSESKKAGGVIHGQWCAKDGTEASGWGNGSMIKAPDGQQYFPSDWGEWVAVGSTPLDEYIDPVSYEIRVNETTALESGVYYDVTGELKQSILELNVNALRWVPQEVEVSYGK